MSLVDVAFSPIHNESVRFCNACNDNSLILIYLSVGASLIPMRVLESESIASVKLRIQKCKGFVVKKQKLVFSGRELARENSLVKDYGLTSGNVLHLVLKLSDLLLVTVETSCGQEFEFHVDRCKNVGYLKKRIVKEGKCCFVDVDEEEIVYNGERLDNTRSVADICNDKDDSIHLLVQKSAKVRAKPVEKDFEILVVAPNEKRDGVGNGSAKNKQPERSYALEPFVVNPKIKLSSVFWDMVKATYDGLERGYEPIRSTEGTGGAYFMRDQFGKYVSVFKPIDEEPMAVNNPQGLPVSTNGEGLKRGTRVGEGAVREVAAYLLDHPKCGPRELSGEVMGFAGVPPTLIVQCLHQGFNHPEGYEGGLTNVKIGSLQMFVKNEGNCDDIGPGAFPVEEVHKISVLDIRVANADRHAGNILITKGEDGQTLLTPIDHGYCLPEKFEDCTFDWLYWPQARQPYSPEVIDYIKSLDAENDIALLKHYGWDVPIECARTLLISTMLLKKGVERGLTPFDIGSIMCRENLNKESVIEEIVREALDSSITGMSEAVLLETISRIMDSQLDKLIRK